MTTGNYLKMQKFLYYILSIYAISFSEFIKTFEKAKDIKDRNKISYKNQELKNLLDIECQKRYQFIINLKESYVFDKNVAIEEKYNQFLLDRILIDTKSYNNFIQNVKILLYPLEKLTLSDDIKDFTFELNTILNNFELYGYSKNRIIWTAKRNNFESVKNMTHLKHLIDNLEIKNPLIRIFLPEYDLIKENLNQYKIEKKTFSG